MESSPTEQLELVLTLPVPCRTFHFVSRRNIKRNLFKVLKGEKGFKSENVVGSE